MELFIIDYLTEKFRKSKKDGNLSPARSSASSSPFSSSELGQRRSISSSSQSSSSSTTSPAYSFRTERSLSTESNKAKDLSSQYSSASTIVSSRKSKKHENNLQKPKKNKAKNKIKNTGLSSLESSKNTNVDLDPFRKAPLKIQSNIVNNSSNASSTLSIVCQTNADPHQIENQQLDNQVSGMSLKSANKNDTESQKVIFYRI